VTNYDLFFVIPWS